MASAIGQWYTLMCPVMDGNAILSIVINTSIFILLVLQHTVLVCCVLTVSEVYRTADILQHVFRVH